MTEQQSISTSLYASQDLVLYSVVEEWVRELSTYRKDALLYHEEHPRIRGHVDAVQELFEAFLNRFGPLELTVEADGLSVTGKPIGVGAASVQTLSGILRERSISKVTIEPQLTKLEVRVLMNILIAPPATVIQAIELEQEDWQHLSFDLNRSKPSPEGTFTPNPAQNPIQELAAEPAPKTSAHIPGLPAELCERIPADCARHLHNLLQSPEAQSRMDDLDQYFHATTTQKRFLARFLEILLENPTVRWDDRDALRDSLFGGFDLLLEAADKYSSIGTLPTQLLIPKAGASDEVSTHFRWSLLQGFFPEAISSQSPREAEDLSFYFRKPGSPLSEPGEIPWSPNRPVDIQASFAAQFEKQALLTEYADVVRELLLGTIDGEDHAKLLLDTSRTLKEQTRGEGTVEPLLSPLLDRWRQLPMQDQGALLAEVVRGAHPDECLDIVSGGDAAIRETLLRVPPLPLDKAVAAEWENYQRPRELLRQVLVRRDDFALVVCARSLLGKNREAAMRGGWLDVFECLATKNPRFLPWMNRNANRCVTSSDKTRAKRRVDAAPRSNRQRVDSISHGDQG